MLKMTAQQQQQLRHHAQQAYPEECCGILIGVVSDDSTRWLVDVIPTRNAWDAIAAEEMAERTEVSIHTLSQTAFASQASSQADDERSRRYWIDPKDIFEAQRYARRLTHPTGQPDIIGFYHSHPNYPAVPSKCDRACAWSTYSYVIVSVRQGTAQAVRSWRLDDRQQFQPEPIDLLTASDAGTGWSAGMA